MRRWGCVALAVLPLAGLMVVCAVTGLAAAWSAYYVARSSSQVEISATGAMALEVGAPDVVTVDNPSGDVTVQALAVDRVQVRLSKSARSFNEAWAERLLNQTHVVATPRGSGGVNVRVEMPSPFLPGSATVDLLVIVPQPQRVEVVAERGDVQIMGMTSDIQVSAREGSVVLQDIAVPNRGVVTTRVGDVRFLGLLPTEEGLVLFRTRTGDIDVFAPANTRCDLDAESRDGEVNTGFGLTDVRSGRSGSDGEWIRGLINGGQDVDLVLRTEEGEVRVIPLP